MNPWLDIPLADYEAHMALPTVGQTELLADVFQQAIERYAPRSVALLGCAGGNGLDRVPLAVERIVAIDINPQFVDRARERYGQKLPNLELLVDDLERPTFDIEPVELAYAGLVFEYVAVDKVLTNLRSLLLPGGVLVAVLQLPGRARAVTPSPYRSLESLAPLMDLVSPQQFRELAARAGFDAGAASEATACGGKSFHIQHLIVGQA